MSVYLIPRNALLLVLIGIIVLSSRTTTGQEEKERPDLTELLKSFRDEFLLIEPGKGKFPRTREFLAPPSKKPRVIEFNSSFYVAKYEVPQNLWRAVMGNNPSRWKGERNSVEMLTFDQAIEFCQKATRLMRKRKLIGDNQIIRLPTEIEWEYVAAAGTKTRYSFGDDVDRLTDHAWYTGNAKGNDPPVGVKRPNPWGLYDVHGYLWEWTIDSWSGEKPLVRIRRTDWPPKSSEPVLRGGSWKDPAGKLETRFRWKIDRKTRDDAVGFRCLLTN